jgi:hypothetical protein
MASVKRFISLTIILIQTISCAGFAFKDPKPNLPPAINLGDSLPIATIVKIRPDGKREILATSPEAMRYIFYRAGCEDGSGLAGLLHHEWKEESRTEEWTGACRSLSSDTIYFRISHPGNSAKYKEFNQITYPFLKKAEEEKNSNYFYKAIEYEPALVDARLNLFREAAEKKKCTIAKRNLSLILLLSPGFPQKRSLERFYKLRCGR